MKILIAEDERISRRLLTNQLTKWGYEVIETEDGKSAWKVLQQPDAPTIAILDWIMPGMDGVDVCRLTRGQKKEGYVYIILLTAKTNKNDITEGLNAGADDYVPKPFDKNELKSRIAVGERVIEYEVALKEKNKELQMYSKEMESLAEERAKQLVHADRMALLGTMSAGIAHEINNPNTSIRLNVETIRQMWDRVVNKSLEEYLSIHPDDTIAAMAQKDGSSILNDIEKGSLRIKGIVDGMKKFVHCSNGNFGQMRPEQCIEDALNICLPKVKQMNVIKEIDRMQRTIRGNPIKITQVLVNLIANAADALGHVPEPTIKISLSERRHGVEIRVQDNGCGIPEENLSSLWEPFFTTKPVGIGTGLGLSISYGIIVEEHGGKIEAVSKKGEGATFTVYLPEQGKSSLHKSQS